jgi:uncharacterized membrane protein
MTNGGPPTMQRRAPRWMWITMILSLAVNLLIVGAVLGALWNFRYVRAFAEGGAPAQFGAFVAGLPSEKRSKVDALMREQRAILKPLRHEMREARKATIAAVTAEPFDKEQLRRLNAAYQQSRYRLRAKRAEIFPEILGLLSAEERKELLEWRRQRRHWRHSHRGDRDGDRD